MTPTPSAAIQRKLNHTLAQWRHWQQDAPLQKKPELEGVLGHGHSNFSFLVCAERRYVVRIDGVNPRAHGISRQAEFHILQEASDVGIAPRPRYFNPELGALVCDYLEPDVNQQRPTQEIGQLLGKIHKLQARHQRLDLQERIAKYENKVHKSGAEFGQVLMEHRGQVLALLDFVSANDSAPVLCHNDLLQANRITHNDQLWALDWEYSAMASRWYDLAVVIEGDELKDIHATSLVETYLQRVPSALELKLIGHFRTIYRYLEILWYATADRHSLNASELEKKIALLRGRLILNP